MILLSRGLAVRSYNLGATLFRVELTDENTKPKLENSI